MAYRIMRILLIAIVVIGGDIEILMIINNDQFTTWLILNKHKRTTFSPGEQSFDRLRTIRHAIG